MTKEKSASNFSAKWFDGAWTFVIFLPLIYFPAPNILSGHPWKVELVLSLFLIAALTFFNFLKIEKTAFSINRNIFFGTILPLCIFTMWSAFSFFWANSTESVLHHTLVWAVYLTLFVFLTKSISGNKGLRINFILLSLIVGAIAVQCIIEYLFSAQIDETFGFRFARYAEIQAAILPLFLSFVLRLNKKHLIYAAFLVSAVWLAILFSMSRGAFLASIIGLGTFIALRLFTKTTVTEKRRLACAALGLILIAFSVQFLQSTAAGQKSSTLTRLTVQDDNPENNFSQNVRLLFAGVGLKMFADNKLTGVGADNFGLEFNKYRAIFSADEKNKAVAGQQEASFPERAHNEYLQILSELGIIGGIIFLLFIFGISRLAFAHIKNHANERQNILIHAAVAGIAAFLFSSLFSSFSFRLMQNGVIFFFLLALLLRNYSSAKPEKNLHFSSGLKTGFAAFCLIFCLSLAALSTFKAASQYFVHSAENEKDLLVAENEFEKAIWLDPANASANYLYGLRLLSEGRYEESGLQINFGIEKGLNTSVCYSELASAQILDNNNPAAEKTLRKAIEIFPYSTFLQTRYASVLNNEGKSDEAEKHFQIAEELNPKQAKTWRIFINEGASVANKYALENKDAVILDSLTPSQAVPFMMTERGILHPEEIVRFNFDN